MSSNFTFLQPWQDIYEEAIQVEQHAITAPRTSVFYARRTIELMINWMYETDKDLQSPYRNELSALMYEPTFKNQLPHDLFNLINYIRKLGNLAAHSQKRIEEYESLRCTKNLHLFCRWFVNQYSETSIEISAFDEALIPRQGASDLNALALQALQKQLAEKDAQEQAHKKQLADYELKLTQLQTQIAGIKRRKKATSYKSPTDYSEAETRELFIDLLLKEAGWDPKGENVAEYKVEGMPNNKGIGYVDYVLWGDDGKPLGLIEAKKTKKNAEEGRRQAELYADCLEMKFNQRPIIFYTNGYDHWIWDDQNYPPRPVQGFYSKDELLTLINRRDMIKPLSSAQVNTDTAGRYYQMEGIQRVLEEFDKKQRKALMVMATGTGKTRVAVALVEILMKHNWVKNVLFLADRTALVKQAKNKFNDFLPQATAVNITKDKENDSSRIVFSTYPTMMNAIDDANNDGKKRFSVGHFDLIIIDEAHRSVYQKYRAIFEYFDSLLVGLTATPKSDIDHNTYELFELEDDVPTYNYDLDQAVKDKFLVPPRQMEVPTKFLRQGLTYAELSDTEKLQYEMTFEDEEGNLPMFITPSEFNDWVFNESTIDEVLAFVMENGIKIEGGDKIGKTIIFAKNHKHAEFIEKRFNKNYPYYGGKTLRIIDNHVNYADSLIDEFTETKPSSPQIAVSVDMLDTGIDIPEVVNLVFFKIVRSKSKFWQMIGRGTRLCEDLIGPGEDKKEFLVFDVCDNFRFFEINPEGIKTGNQKSLSQSIFEYRLELALLLQSAEHQQNPEVKELYEYLLDLLHEDVNALDHDSFALRSKKRYLDEYIDRSRWDNLSKNDLLDLKTHVAPSINLVSSDDEFARRFDQLILQVQLNTLKPKPSLQVASKRIRDTAKFLSEKANIPAIAEHLDLIKEIQKDEFWQDVTVEKLEDVRTSLRDLVKLLDKSQRKVVYTNFKDDLIYDPSTTGEWNSENSMKNYRNKIGELIRQYDYHPSIQKLKNNEKLDSKDIIALQELIFNTDLSPHKSEIQSEFAEENLGVFIRKIVGLDRAAAKRAFASFIEQNNLNAAQMHFIDELVNYITQKGIASVGNLYEQPFTDIDDRGPNGLFEDRELDQLFGIVNEIQRNADINVFK